MKSLRPLLLPWLAVLLVLAACGRGPTPEPLAPASVTFTAEPVLAEPDGSRPHDGDWLLLWSAPAGAQVALDGGGVTRAGQRAVWLPGPTTFTLRAEGGGETVTRELRLAPVTQLVLEHDHEPQPTLPAGTSLQLTARVLTADPAALPASPAITWSSSDPAVATVAADGLVQLLASGVVQIWAASRQDPGVQRYETITVHEPPVFDLLAARGLADGAGSWEVSWRVLRAETLTLDGEDIASEGTLTVTPAEVTSYQFVATGDGVTVMETLVLAPVSGVRVDQATGGELPDMMIGESVQLSATVLAAGSAVGPLQEVVWSASPAARISVSPDGRLEALGHGAATVTAESVQDNSRRVSVIVHVLPPGVHDFSVANPASVEAGATVDLRWRVLGIESLTIIEEVGGSERQVAHVPFPLPAASHSVTLPDHKPNVQYRLEAVDIDGGEHVLSLEGGPLTLPGWVCRDAADPITFADALVEAEVRRIFSLPPAGAITCGIVQPAGGPGAIGSSENAFGQETHNAIVLNRCDGGVEPISSLEGVQHLLYLRRLEAECSNVSNIRLLRGLTHLVELNFDNNDITDVRPLTGMNQLRVLGLYNNDLEDVTGLEGLHALEILYLSENRVHDLSPLAGLANLQHAWVYLNCRNVTRHPDGWVENWSDCLRDLSPLADLHDLVSVVFHQNEVESIGFISPAMQDLQLVVAAGNRIRDAAPLAGLPALLTARLDDNLLAGIAPLAANTSFPTGPQPYLWQRGTVIMPPNGAFDAHLAIGYNCFRTDDPAVIAAVNAVTARSGIVTGLEAETKGPEHGCGAGAAGHGTPPQRPAWLLEQLHQLRHRP